MTDPIADMLTRIRNAQMVNKPTVTMPMSKLKKSLANILAEEGYIDSSESIELNGKPALKIILRYVNDGSSVIQSVKRISKPGRRVYARTKELPYVLNDFGIAIISTPQGLMTNKEARKQKLGGEILCEIY